MKILNTEEGVFHYGGRFFSENSPDLKDFWHMAITGVKDVGRCIIVEHNRKQFVIPINSILEDVLAFEAQQSRSEQT